MLTSAVMERCVLGRHGNMSSPPTGNAFDKAREGSVHGAKPLDARLECAAKEQRWSGVCSVGNETLAPLPREMPSIKHERAMCTGLSP